jgi:hypothetical protein
MPNNLWINDAQREEQGSFCDIASGHQYDNVSGFSAVQQAQSAEERGDEAIWTDKSVFGLGDPSRPQDAVQIDDRCNIYMSEEDSQGVNTPSLYGPGR